MMTTFNIVEGDDFDYDSFNRDYCNLKYSKKDLQEKYNLSNGAYYNRSKYATECTGFRRKAGRITDKDTRNIYKKSKHYTVEKKIDNSRRYCGTYKDLKTACMVRDILEECGYDDNMIKECIKLYGIRRNTDGHNQHNSPLQKEALDKYDDFEELFFKGEHSYYEMLDELNFTRHMYNVCYAKLKRKYGKIRKSMVRRN